MKQNAIHVVLILAVAGTVLFANLGKARLWDRDEPRNAGCAAEMMERGDFIVPIFNDELRHQKPVLLYWLMMSAYAVFGVNEFSARFWSAVLAMGTAFLTYGIGRRLFSPNVGLFAAIILSTSLMFGVAGRAATPDSVLIFCSTLALFIYVFGTFRSKEAGADAPQLRVEGKWFPVSRWVAVALYGVMGFGVLAKGLAGAVLPTAIIGMFLLIQRLPTIEKKVGESHSRAGQLLISIARTFNPWHFLKTCWAMRPLTAVAMILVVAAPWYVAVGIQTEGDFLKEFLIGEHFGRATEAMENHSGSVLYYPATLLLGFFPWSIFIVPVVIAMDRILVRRENWSPGIVMMLCWVCVQVGIFSIAKTKLPSYVTPCYPALAMITAIFLYRLSSERELVPRFWVKGSFAAAVFAGIAIVGGMVFVAKEYLPGEFRLAALGAIPLLGGAVALGLFWKEKTKPAIAAVICASVLFTASFFGLGTVFVDSHQVSHSVVEKARDINPEAKLASYRCLESSWVVYAQRPIVELIPVVSETQNVDSQRERFWHDQPDLPVRQFFEENPGGLLVTRTETLDELKPFLPANYEILERTPFFLQKDELVLLGPKQSDNTVEAPVRQAEVSRYRFQR